MKIKIFPRKSRLNAGGKIFLYNSQLRIISFLKNISKYFFHPRNKMKNEINGWWLLLTTPLGLLWIRAKTMLWIRRKQQAGVKMRLAMGIGKIVQFFGLWILSFHRSLGVQSAPLRAISVPSILGLNFKRRKCSIFLKWNNNFFKVDQDESSCYLKILVEITHNVSQCQFWSPL